jgi:hypothetical protein
MEQIFLNYSSILTGMRFNNSNIKVKRDLLRGEHVTSAESVSEWWNKPQVTLSIIDASKVIFLFTWEVSYTPY